MSPQRETDILSIIARAFLGYLAYFFSVPAILLQAFALFCGVSGVIVIVLSYDPGFVQATLIALLADAGLSHTSYRVNPVPSILRWYLLLALLFDIFGSIFLRIFPFAIPSARQFFVWMLGIDFFCYVLFGSAFLLSGGSLLPAILLFAVTLLFTAIAFAASRLPHLAR